jgi:mevalonate kinase
MPVSKQRKNQKKKSIARTSKLKDDAKKVSKKFLENYNKIMEAKKQFLQSKNQD